MTGLPRTTLVRRNNTHRLIPSKYRPEGSSVLMRIADDEAHLSDIFDLDSATNDRLLADNERLPGIGVHELVFGVPCYRIVNAAFTHAHPLGSRFNGSDRGAWVAASTSGPRKPRWPSTRAFSLPKSAALSMT